MLTSLILTIGRDIIVEALSGYTYVLTLGTFEAACA